MSALKLLATLLMALGWLALETSTLAAEVPIRCWIRGQGQYEDGEIVKPDGERMLNLDTLPKISRKSKDIQYDGATRTYIGVKLTDVIDACKLTNAAVDAVLLHFANGMIVPVSYPDSSLTKMDALVALGIRGKSDKDLKSFPPVGKKDERFNDPRPIRFTTNKIVVTSGFHPDVAESTAKDGFTPWRFTDTLKGIEFVNRKAWFAQFDVDAAASEGFKVYQTRCQYCHGARKVGASFGWDYVTPLPIFEKRDPKSIFNHLKYPKWDALQMGLMMPAQGKMTEHEAEALWQWMKAVATVKHLKPYKI